MRGFFEVGADLLVLDLVPAPRLGEEGQVAGAKASRLRHRTHGEAASLPDNLQTSHPWMIAAPGNSRLVS
jgi:hypothetical protein